MEYSIFYPTKKLQQIVIKESNEKDKRHSKRQIIHSELNNSVEDEHKFRSHTVK
jgi:hypothetical protein